MDRHYQGNRDGRESQRDGWLPRDRNNYFRENRDMRGNRDSRDEPPRAVFGRGQNFAGTKRQGEEGSSREVRQMTEEDLRHKLNRDQDDRRRGMPPPPQPHRWDQGRREDKRPSKDLASDLDSGMLCYNCNQVGHHKSQCTNPSFCYGCKQSGHISSKCPNAKQNKGLRLCGFGMPGQLFYSMNIPEEKSEEVAESDKKIRAIVTVHEGRATRFRVATELNYLVGSEIDWGVKRLSSAEFMISVPSPEILNLLKRMGKIKFMCYDMLASVEETDRDPNSFDTLYTVWVKALGIPNISRKENHVMELAYLVGDPEEVHLESFKRKEVWVKVACKDPMKISGTSAVYINKQGHKISWAVSEKDPTQPPENIDKGPDDDEATDEEEPESQDSFGLMDYEWLNPGPPPHKGSGSDQNIKEPKGGNVGKQKTVMPECGQDGKSEIPKGEQDDESEKNIQEDSNMELPQPEIMAVKADETTMKNDQVTFEQIELGESLGNANDNPISEKESKGFDQVIVEDAASDSSSDTWMTMGDFDTEVLSGHKMADSECNQEGAGLKLSSPVPPKKPESYVLCPPKSATV